MKSFPANLALTIQAFAILFISFYSLSCALSIKDPPGPEKKHSIYGMKDFTKQNSENRIGILVFLKAKKAEVEKYRKELNEWSGFYQNSKFEILNVLEANHSTDQIIGERKNIIQFYLEPINQEYMWFSLITLFVFPSLSKEQIKVLDISSFDSNGVEKKIPISEDISSVSCVTYYGWVFLPFGLPMKYYNEEKYSCDGRGYIHQTIETETTKIISDQNFIVTENYKIDTKFEQDSFSRFPTNNEIQGNYSGEVVKGNYFESFINMKKPAIVSKKLNLGNTMNRSVTKVSDYNIGGEEKLYGNRHEVVRPKDITSSLPPNQFIQMEGSCQNKSTRPLLGLDKWAPTNIYEFTCPAKVLKIGE